MKTILKNRKTGEEHYFNNKYDLVSFIDTTPIAKTPEYQKVFKSVENWGTNKIYEVFLKDYFEMVKI